MQFSPQAFELGCSSLGLMLDIIAFLPSLTREDCSFLRLLLLVSYLDVPSPYGLYFFLFFPLLPWRVSMVKGKSGCTLYQFQFVLDSPVFFGIWKSFIGSSGRSQLFTTSFPSFLSRVPFSFTSQAGSTIK